MIRIELGEDSFGGPLVYIRVGLARVWCSLDAPVLFSERMGYRRPLRIGRLAFFARWDDRP